MKKMFLILAIAILVSSCSITQKQRNDLVNDLSPYGLIIQESQGKSWWKGTYNGRPVLVQLIKTYGYYHVEFQFID